MYRKSSSWPNGRALIVAAVSVSLVVGLTGRGIAPAAAAPMAEEDPIEVFGLNNGTMAETYLYQPDRNDQKFALWIPDGLKVVKGIVFSLHRASEAHRTELQEFARAMDFAVYGVLSRWKDFEILLPAQLGGLGKRLGHPEVVNVPWAALCFSRNVGAMCRYIMADPNKDRILCLLTGGGPGIDMDLNNPEQVRLFKHIPMMTVNGSADPFVNGMNWNKGLYPQTRRAGMPRGCAAEWGLGHGSHNNTALYWPFLKAVMAVRYPKDASPADGIVRLEPFPQEQGWLIGPVNWQDKWGDEAAPFGKYTGDPAQAVWLPDEYTVAVWRAFVSKDPPAAVLAESKDGGHVTLRLDRVPEAGFKQVKFYDGHRLLGESSAAPFAVQTDNLAEGVHSIFAVCTDAAGRSRRTRPIVVISGKTVDQRAGMRAAAESDMPVNAIQISDKQRDTLEALIARRNCEVPSDWKRVFSDDFQMSLGPAWSEYYAKALQLSARAGGGGGRATIGHDRNSMKVVDGALQIQGPVQVVAMLAYDWPDDVAVECRAKSLAEKPCDLSVILSGAPYSQALAWRGGMMFQFGGHMNEGSHFTILEQPHRNWEAKDCGARIVRGKWHRLRIERAGPDCKAFVDGKLVAHEKLSDEQREGMTGRKIGFYTFAGTAQFDDVKVYVRAPKDPAAVKPAMPAEADLDDLAAGLVKALSHRHAEQQGSAERLARDYSFELVPSFCRLLQKGAIQDGKINALLKARVDAALPE